MKRLSLPVLFVIFVLLLTSCDASVTPVAYTRFDATGSQVVVYTTQELGNNILVYADAGKTSDPIMEFQFNRCLGPDELNGKKYTVVALDDNQDLRITVKMEYYSITKQFYLNGTPIPTTEDHDEGSIHVYFFKSIGNRLQRTNPNGSINPDLVNYIEYK